MGESAVHARISPDGVARPRPPQEEIDRITEEYRRGSYARKAPATVVYSEVHELCPWADCDLCIRGIDFHLEKLGDETTIERLLRAWWRGSGLVGDCPQCHRPVLFALDRKEAVEDTAAHEAERLPGRWHEKSQVLPKPKP